jgi:hypothetical protein
MLTVAQIDLAWSIGEDGLAGADADRSGEFGKNIEITIHV